MGGDEDRAKIRSDIEAEITTLAKRQIEAVKDATFTGWDPAESVAYEERRVRPAWLRKQLARLDAD